MSLEDILSQGISAYTDIETARAESRPSNPVPQVRGAAGASTQQGTSASAAIPSLAKSIPIWGWAAGGVLVALVVLMIVKR